MNDWVGLVNSVKDGTYEKDKYEQMSKVNNSSALISGIPINNNQNAQQQQFNQGQPAYNQSMNPTVPQLNNQPQPIPQAATTSQPLLNPAQSSNPNNGSLSTSNIATSQNLSNPKI